MSGTSSPHRGLTRRGFLKTTGAAAGAAVVGSSLVPYASAMAETDATIVQDEIFNCNCRSNCMGSCRLLAHVREGGSLSSNLVIIQSLGIQAVA